jgi:hypothetical protein
MLSGMSTEARFPVGTGKTEFGNYLLGSETGTTLKSLALKMTKNCVQLSILLPLHLSSSKTTERINVALAKVILEGLPKL